MHPNTFLALSKEIRARMPSFKNGPFSYQAACARISDFLQNGLALQSAFQDLERRMLSNMRLKRGHKLITPVVDSFVLRTRSKERGLGGPTLQPHQRHVLADVLAETELLNGFPLFAVEGRDVSATVAGVLTPTAFRAHLMAGRLSKDPTVPNGHGEFTHRIQWHLLMNASPSLLTGRWVDLYRWIGSVCDGRDFRNAHPGTPWLGLWDLLFDRNKWTRNGVNGPFNTTDPLDFRSPENLHKHLRHLRSCPVLSGFIEGRHRKRKNQGMFNAPVVGQKYNAATKNYLARKIHGVDYAQLSRTDREAIDQRKHKVLIPGTFQPQYSDQQRDDALEQTIADAGGTLL
jgi:hypothetical protein